MNDPKTISTRRAIPSNFENTPFLEMKKHHIEIHAEAKIDFYAQIEYLAEQNCSIETLHRFLDEMEAASEAIGQNTFTWPFARPSKRVRKFGPTKNFRYLIFYVVLTDGTPRIIEYLGPGRQPRWTARV
jgi:hypothetical protein